MVSIHDSAALARLRQEWRVDPDQLRRLRNAFYKKQATADEAPAHVPEPQRAGLASALSFQALEMASRHDSRIDGATKILWRTSAGLGLESVILRIASGRTSLCVSSQVGCAARCGFCATGFMGMAVNLSRAEILDQIIQANRLLKPEGRVVRNVVFMGMGEPLHNEAAVYEAIDVLLAPGCFNIAPSRIVLSTVGIPEALARCAERFPRIGLALSLHSARQEVRAGLMPLARRYPLDVLRAALVRATAISRRPLLIEYLLFDGLNDAAEDLEALSAYLRGLPVHVNLIPYNPIAEAPSLRGTSPARRLAFAAGLKAAGFVVTIRYSLGADIAAACGQLVRRANTRHQPAEPYFSDMKNTLSVFAQQQAHSASAWVSV